MLVVLEAPQSLLKGGSIVGTLLPIHTATIVLLVATIFVHGFAPRTISPLRPHRVQYPTLNNNAAEEDHDNSKDTMDYVRSLQDIFYSDTAGGSPYLEAKTGMMRNLPIFRAPSTELPGRSSIRFIDDPMDTNMFETLLRSSRISSDSPYRYVGQLFQDPNQSMGLLNRSILRRWEDQVKDSSSDDNQSTCIGTLLRIMDFRRVNDGRMVLLVQGIERFVVIQACQQLPYPVADVQIVPDDEDFRVNGGPSNRISSLGETIDALFGWHSYEYDDRIRFSGQNSPGRDVSIETVIGEGLSQLLPFIPFSDSVNPNDIASNIISAAEAASSSDERVASTLLNDLASTAVLQEVPTYELAMQGSGITAEDLEYDIWVCIDEYVRLRELEDVISPDLLSLLPQDKDWPCDFVLEDITSKWASEAGRSGKQFVRVNADYPSQRRQRRLSYSATGLLGGSTPTELLNKGVRQTLLETPSTHGRLWAVLERFVEYNAQLRSNVE